MTRRPITSTSVFPVCDGEDGEQVCFLSVMEKTVKPTLKGNMGKGMAYLVNI